jgi:hypothetical protein
MLGAAFMARDAGDLAAAQVWTEQGLAVYREIGDRWGLGMATLSLALQHSFRGENAAGRELLVEALDHFRAVGHLWGMASAHFHLGHAARVGGDLRAARAQVEESLRCSRASGDKRGMSHSLDYLGRLAWLEGDHAAARRFLEESRSLAREIGLKDDSNGAGLGILLTRSEGDHAGALAQVRAYLRQVDESGLHQNIPRALIWAGILAADERDFGRAARLISAGMRLRPAFGRSDRLLEENLVEASLAAIRAGLGESAYAEARAAGEAMTLDEALASALEEHPPVVAPPPPARGPA